MKIDRTTTASVSSDLGRTRSLFTPQGWKAFRHLESAAGFVRRRGAWCCARAIEFAVWLGDGRPDTRISSDEVRVIMRELVALGIITSTKSEDKWRWTRPGVELSFTVRDCEFVSGFDAVLDTLGTDSVTID